MEIPVEYIQTLVIRDKDDIKVRRCGRGSLNEGWLIFCHRGPICLWNFRTGQWVSSTGWISDFTEYQRDDLAVVIEIAKGVPKCEY